MVAEDAVLDGADDGHRADAEQQGRGHKALGHAGLSVRAAEARLDGLAQAGERAVEIQKRARGGAEDHGDDQHQRIFALEHTADAGIERAERDGGHDRAGDLFRDAFPGQKTDGAAEQDGQRIDENSEHAKRSFLKAPVKIATIVPHRVEKRKIFFEK